MAKALPDAVVTTVDTPITISVLANDVGDNLVVTSFSNPANGSLVFNADKSFTYTPLPGFLGDDDFSYTIRDAQGSPATAEVSISVIADDGRTIAVDDAVEVTTGGEAFIPVLANDLAAGNGTLQIIAVSMPSHGTVKVLPDQTIRYVPQSGFVGIDSFTYSVVDMQGEQASASVTIKVLAANSPPLAVDDLLTVGAGQTTVLAVLANDSDPDGGPLSIVGFTMPGHGTLAFNPDKTFSYTPDAGYLGIDQFTYTIRDNGGASATASVTFTVIEISESPAAADDQITTEAGQPVTIDVLANDSLPAGQQTTIIALTLPYKGQLAVNPDKTLTYTPNAGFVGIDDFTYTIGNRKGAASTATVTVEVTAAAEASLFSNGYRYRRRIVLPSSAAEQTTVGDVVVLFAEEASWLKTMANGGKVSSPDGNDLRFELVDGSKLDHEIESYDPLTGKLIAWIRLPSWSLAQQFHLIVYYGNAAIDSSESNPAGVWQGYLARWRLPDGSDATGQGRNLVPQNVAAGMLLGAAASLDGTGQFDLDDTGWLDGLEAMTMQALVKPDASMIGGSAGILAQVASDVGTPAIAFGYQAETAAGVSNVIYAEVNCADGIATAFSRADRQTSDRQLLHARWQSGIAPRLYLNGDLLKTSSSQARAGTMQAAGGRVEVGRNWIGLIDEVRITERALPAAWLAVEATNMLSPELSYGLGKEEAAGSDEQPVVAVPFRIKTNTGKWVDIDVLGQSFAPADGEAPSITSLKQPANGTATVMGNVVRYTPMSDFVGKDQFTYTISNGQTQSTGLIAIVVADPTPDNSELAPGENLLINSRLLGASANGADDWTVSFPEEGSVIFAETWDEHRTLRCISTDAARPAIEQEMLVEQGKRYTFSVDCVAVVDAADSNRVVLNHIPFSAGTLLSNRPTLGDLVAGQQVHYSFEATQSRRIRLRVGFEAQQGSGGGDVTLERPMFDQSGSLRNYVATNPSSSGSDASTLNWEIMPYYGWYEGQIRLLSSQQTNMRIRSGYYGWTYTARRTGTIAAVQHQIASNHGNGETSKSTWNGNNNHARPVTFPLGIRVFNATSDWQISGSPLRDVQWNYTNTNGGQGETDGDARVIFEHGLNLPVTEGQRLLFLVYNRHPDPENHCPSVNMAANQEIRPAFGQNPPVAVTRFFGDDPTFIRSDDRGGTLSRNGDRLYNLGIRYTDGVEDGSVAIDSNSNFSEPVGGSGRVRQRFSSPYWRKTGQIALAILRNGTPAAGVTVRLSGPDISTMEFTIPVGQINRRDTEEHVHKLYDMPGEVILSPDTVYTVELLSPGSASNAYIIHGQRQNRNMKADASVSTNSFVTGEVIDPHRWSGLAEHSKDGGSSWSYLGYGSNPQPSADWPIALVLNRNIALSAEALPA